MALKLAVIGFWRTDAVYLEQRSNRSTVPVQLYTYNMYIQMQLPVPVYSCSKNPEFPRFMTKQACTRAVHGRHGGRRGEHSRPGLQFAEFGHERTIVSQRWQRPLCDFMVQLDGPTEQSRLVEVRVLTSTGLVLVVRGV